MFTEGFKKTAAMVKLAPKDKKKKGMIDSGTAKITSDLYTGYAPNSNDPQDG